MSNVFIYVVARDFGFAPNPFHGVCTLACCKPKIRSVANEGDWVFGVGGRDIDATGRCIFGMRVSEAFSFEDYWLNPKFHCKRPVRNGSRATMVGDNIYSRCTPKSHWRQSDSHHSKPDGSPDISNIKKDTDVNRVLVSNHFIYFGSAAPLIQRKILDEMGYRNGIGHRKFDEKKSIHLLNWFSEKAASSLNTIVDNPFNFHQNEARYSAEKNKVL